MKKLFFAALLACLSIGAQAQNVKIQETQARALDVQSNAYVQPLVVELKIDEAKGRISETVTVLFDKLPKEIKLEEMNNIRSLAIYEVTKKYKCDVIVAPIINVVTNEKGDGLDVTVTGFAANYQNWRTANSNDLEWIKLEKIRTVSESEKIEPVVRK
ncbi:MAG: hypothetical protein K6G70_07750 [Bacteroidaceae bacterium]|nr:hypothetical protein [Bacteroidaceae bacterium]